jgi:hypothetical protein
MQVEKVTIVDDSTNNELLEYYPIEEYFNGDEMTSAVKISTLFHERKQYKNYQENELLSITG